jgi:hypothetical protein
MDDDSVVGFSVFLWIYVCGEIESLKFSLEMVKIRKREKRRKMKA